MSSELCIQTSTHARLMFFDLQLIQLDHLIASAITRKYIDNMVDKYGLTVKEI